MPNKSLFDYTLGKKAENTTSAVLAFILNGNNDSNKNERNVIKKLFNIKENIDYECNDQKCFGKSVQFDLVIESSDQFIVVENKLDASFTWSNDGEHQLIRYLKWLIKESNKDKNKEYSLIILCPERRKTKIENELINEIKEANLKPKQNIYKFVIWEDLCKQLSNENKISEITKQLLEFINCRYLFDEKIEIEGRKMITNKEAGKAYFQLLKIVDTIYNNLDERYNAKYDNNNCWWYGFNFEKSKTTYFFGVWPEVWAKKGSPLILQQITGNKIKPKFESVDVDSFEEADKKQCIYCFKNLESLESIEEELRSLLDEKNTD